MSKEESVSKEEQAQKDLLKKYSALSNKLLGPAIEFSDVQRKAVYPIAASRTQDFYSTVLGSNLKDLVTGHLDPESKKEYASEKPVGAYILVDDIDHTKAAVPRGFKETFIMLGLRYKAHHGRLSDLIIEMAAGKPKATSYRIGSDHSETAGYKEDDWKIQELTIDQLQDFYKILSNKANIQSPLTSKEEYEAARIDLK